MGRTSASSSARNSTRLDPSLADKLNAGGMEAAAAARFGTRTARALDLASGPAGGEDRRRGRGTLTNASGRFEKQEREAYDDGWG
ncbi:hypothetical protein, partial [Stenotrophomonas maltophilia]|uniref:hypothetical protein n=1 Tax=Stenotrophomonas maltophilia TaxID=40324 RepID=UPI001954E458